MYHLYIANKNYSSWSLRPWVLMKALNIPFKEVLMPFKEGSNWQEFREFSPNGLVPCLVEGDGTQPMVTQSQVVWDSLAICEYLAETFPEVWPADRAARAWARSASAEMHSGFNALRSFCPMSCGLRVELTEVPDALRKNLDRLDELWSEGLESFGGPYLAGDKYTAVDAFYAPVVFRLNTYAVKMSVSADNYLNHALALESMQEWYQAALIEPWREPGHERESLALGRLIEDLRTN